VHSIACGQDRPSLSDEGGSNAPAGAGRSARYVCPGGQTAPDTRLAIVPGIGAWLVPGVMLVIATLLAAQEPEAAGPA